MKVGFIGAGNMGGAIMRGAFQHGFLKPYETMVYDVSEQQLASVTRCLSDPCRRKQRPAGAGM